MVNSIQLRLRGPTGLPKHPPPQCKTKTFSLPLTSSEDPLLFAWNADLAAKRSNSWLWRGKSQEAADVWRNCSILEPCEPASPNQSAHLSWLDKLQTLKVFCFFVFSFPPSSVLGTDFFVYNHNLLHYSLPDVAFLEWCVLSNRLK